MFGGLQLANGNMEVGVHIADVTHFVHPGSAVDNEAADRCATINPSTLNSRFHNP